MGPNGQGRNQNHLEGFARGVRRRNPGPPPFSSRNSTPADSNACLSTARVATHAEAMGGGRATTLASLRRFCAIAASVTSNRAPYGPRNRSRLSRRIRFKCANSISTVAA
jgi:hypothetical protein